MFNYNLKPVDKNDSTKIQVEIPSGVSVKQIGKILKEKDLIRNVNVFFLYCKIYNPNLKATVYDLSKDMSIKDIVKILQEGNNYNPNQISITFNEGITMKKLANIIANNTNNKYDDVMNLVKDTTYIDELIKEYWFITDEIKNKDIYYPLEGYLYPDTYLFNNKDVTVKEIFKKMLDETSKVLEKHKSIINNSKYTVHEILTLASIVEQEGVKAEDRNGIASVFLNRLNSNWQLGSDVTAYYGLGIDMSEGSLTSAQLNDQNAYNTRPASMAGKLPVGPISNVSETSIKAVLYPIETDYYFFVADKYGQVYFMKTYDEHIAKINQLKSEGAWLG